MCRRTRLSSDVSEIKLVFRIRPERSTPNFAPSWNVAPTDPLPIVRYDAKVHQRSRVHWVRPELGAEVKYLTWTSHTTCCAR
jgi:putative SOS response-associated peptidase YedK